ncbi:MAG: TonB-dependent receptor [Paludibacteraceae bacterium]|nr:TonB-dependent receptor [Paludibacteraceae bacterium]MBN2787087.1 TonB-dependent receptor [Paludibacteraceae bacterium]
MKKNISFLRLVLLFVFATFLHGVVMAQTKKVTGVVKDEAGEALIGVSVQVKGTAVGSMTDFNGAYSIDVPEGSTTLVFSYIGMKTQELPISGELVSATLVSDTKELEDVVVVGYGVMKKRDLTGAVGSLKSSDLQSVSSNNALEAMQGKIAGLDISKTSGAAGEGVKINLRGNRSVWANNEPLYIVDGVDYGSTIDLNTSDIESMEVLKDASSTAIYGTRGANGVIIITTKRGKKGGTKNALVTYNGYISSNSPTKVPSTMTAEQDVDFLIEKARRGDYMSGDPVKVAKSENRANYSYTDVLGAGGQARALYEAGTSVDWFDEILNNSITHNHELSVVGGSENTAYNFSLGYLNENGLMKNDNLTRYNAKFGIDHKVAKGIDLGGSLLYTKRDWNRREDEVFSQVIKMHALSDILLDIPSDLAPAHTNPLINEREGYYQNNTQSDRIFGNAYLNIEFIKGLNFKTMFAADMNNSFKGIYEDYMITSRNQSNKETFISQEKTNEYNLTWDNTLNYALELKSGHDIQILLGQSTIMKESLYGMVSGDCGKEHYFSNSYYNLNNVTSFYQPQSSLTPENMESYFGRLNYKFKDKYLFQATYRADGSSVLSEGNKWGYFPSVSAAWRIKDEKFMQNVKLISNLKLRASWGVAGNAAVQPFGTLSTLVSDFQNNYSFGDVNSSGYVPGNLANKELGWETTSTTDIGLDFGLFKDRISGSIDVYFSETNDLLMYKTVPLTTGYTAAWENVGSTENKGIEIALNTVNVKTKGFVWSSDWTFSMNKDKVTSLASGLTQDLADPSQALVVGMPVMCFLDYESLGVWGTDEVAEAAVFGEHPGQMKLKDQNGDNLITDEDRILFNKSPKFIFGWNNHLSYKNFTLSILSHARVGQWIAYDLYDSFNPIVVDGTPNMDYWTPENQEAWIPRPGETSTKYSALNKVKASYLKVKDITLAYAIPKKLVSKIGLSNAKVYGSMKNFFTFSDIDNYDPEQEGTVSNPLMKQIVFGLNLQF